MTYVQNMEDGIQESHEIALNSLCRDFSDNNLECDVHSNLIREIGPICNVAQLLN